MLKNMAGTNQLKNLPDTLKWWNYVRWLSTISFLSVGIIQMSISGDTFPIHAFVLTLLAITLLNIVYSLWIDNFKYNSIFPLIHNLMDITIFSMAIFMTGGTKSPFLWGYLIPILTSSITIGRAAGFAASLLSIGGLISISYISKYSLSAAQKSAYGILNLNIIDTRTMLSFACLFFLVYFISSFLANALRIQNNNLKLLNLQLREKNNTIIESQEKLIEMKQRDFIYQTSLTLQHEINNPLAILSLNTEMLANEIQDFNTTRINTITDSVQRIKAILDKIRQLQAGSFKTKNALQDLQVFDLESIEHNSTGINNA